MEKQLANQIGDTLNGPTQPLSPTPIANSPPHPERVAVHSRDAGRSSTSRAEPATAEGRDMQGLLSLGQGSTLAGLADKVPAGRSIPDGAEQVVVMNGSRLHERRYEGKWEVQKSDPQGMLPKGVYQVHGNGVARHEPAAFQQVPKIGDSPKIVYANGRATITGLDPQSQGQGRSR